MRAVVKGFHSPDVDLETFAPDDVDDFGILLQIMVGTADAPGEDWFDIMVCTPRWIGQDIESKGPFIGRHTVLVNSYNFTEIRTFLTKIIEVEMASSWEELALKIGRIGRWEFEDYTP